MFSEMRVLFILKKFSFKNKYLKIVVFYLQLT